MLSADMKEQFVYDPLISKRQQYLLATQVRVDITVFFCLLSSVDSLEFVAGPRSFKDRFVMLLLLPTIDRLIHSLISP